MSSENVPSRDWTAYEPWFKAWLVTVPLVAWGSQFIIRNARLRLAQLRADSLDVPEPEGTWGYAVACAVAFTLLMAILAQLWVQSVARENNTD